MREAIGKDEKERNKSLGFLEERGDRKKMLEEIMAEKRPNLMKTLST